MNRTKAIAVFDEYVSNYDREDPMIYFKIYHSYKVAEIAERIARSLNREEVVDFAWLIGLLHDIGRFEQVRRYHTFEDARSVDHAELGSDILFKERLIDRFPTEMLPEGWQGIAETAIRQHNKLAIPEGLDEISYKARNGGKEAVNPENCEISPEVMACVREHRCVPSNVRKSYFDRRVSHCCLAFELVYEESRRIAKEQGYLLRLLNMQDGDGGSFGNDEQRRQLALVKKEIEAAWQGALER